MEDVLYNAACMAKEMNESSVENFFWALYNYNHEKGMKVEFQKGYEALQEAIVCGVYTVNWSVIIDLIEMIKGRYENGML